MEIIEESLQNMPNPYLFLSIPIFLEKLKNEEPIKLDLFCKANPTSIILILNKNN